MKLKKIEREKVEKNYRKKTLQIESKKPEKYLQKIN